MILNGIFEALEKMPVIVACRGCGKKFDAAGLDDCPRCGAGCVNNGGEASEAAGMPSGAMDGPDDHERAYTAGQGDVTEAEILEALHNVRAP